MPDEPKPEVRSFCRSTWIGSLFLLVVPLPYTLFVFALVVLSFTRFKMIQLLPMTD